MQERFGSPILTATCTILGMEVAMFPDVHRPIDIVLAILLAIAAVLYILPPLWDVYRGEGARAALNSLMWLVLSFVS